MPFWFIIFTLLQHVVVSKLVTGPARGAYLFLGVGQICNGNEMDLDQVPSLWRNKAVELNIATLRELVKIHFFFFFFFEDGRENRN